MARYVPKHRRRPTLAERRRSFGLVAFAVSSAIGLSGTYGFVPGVQAQEEFLPRPVGAVRSGSSAVGSPAVVTSTRFDTATRPSVAARPSTVSSGAAVANPSSASSGNGSRRSTQSRPAWLDIESIGTSSRLVNLSLREDGTLEVPEVASRAGWYSAGVVPGDPGAAVIVGHVDSYLGSAVFSRLHELSPGDLVRVANEDGEIVTFSVDRVDQYPKKLFPSALVYSGSSKSELRLITCGGNFDASRRSYKDNVVVYASKV